MTMPARSHLVSLASSLEPTRRDARRDDAARATTAGTIVELASAHDLRCAVAALRARGVTRLEIYAPAPVAGLASARGGRRSLALVAALAGVAGVIAGCALRWLIDVHLRPVEIGGRPPQLALACVPIALEMGVVFAGVATFVACVASGRLDAPWHPAHEIAGFASATREGFWLVVDAGDPHHDATAIATTLAAAVGTGTRRIVPFGARAAGLAS